jgi:hypothetical protein
MAMTKASSPHCVPREHTSLFTGADIRKVHISSIINIIKCSSISRPVYSELCVKQIAPFYFDSPNNSVSWGYKQDFRVDIFRVFLT